MNKALYGWPPSGRIWFDKVSTCLHNNGFHTLGNSGTFMMLDQQDLPGDAGWMTLLNLYSDNGLGSTDNSALWDSCMLSFKAGFKVLEKDPDYFPKSDVPLSGILSLGLSSLTRENVCAKSTLNITWQISTLPPSPCPQAGRFKWMKNGMVTKIYVICISRSPAASTMQHSSGPSLCSLFLNCFVWWVA